MDNEKYVLNYRHRKDVTDVMLGEVVKRRSDLTHVDLSKCSSISPIGVMNLVQNLPRLQVLKLEGCSGLFTSWKMLPTDNKEEHTKKVGKERAAVEAIKNNLTLTEINLKACQFCPSEALKLLAQNKRLRSVNLGDCKHVKDDVVQLFCKNRNLEAFHLAGCAQITDTAVRALATLPFIKNLNLTMCTQLSDESAEALGGIKTLEALSLNGCQNIKCRFNTFQGHKALSYLDLSQTGVSDTEVSIVCTIQSLESLYLDNCTNITKTSMRSIGSLSLLRSLSLSACSGVTNVNALGSLPKLVSLALAKNPQLTDFESMDISKISTLQSLNLNTSTLVQAVVRCVRELPDLKTLSLSGCTDISDEIVPVLADASSLEEIDISGTSITSKAFQLVGNRKVPRALFDALVYLLKAVDFSNCTNIQVSTFELVLSSPQVTELNFTNCPQVDDAVFRKIMADCQNVTRLKIGGTRVTSSVFQRYRGIIPEMGLAAILDTLHEIDLSRSVHAKDSLLETIAQNSNVKKVDLSYCDQITDVGLRSLMRSTCLESLNLSGVPKITARGLLALSKLKSIKTLNLTDVECVDGDVLLAWGLNQTLEEFIISKSGVFSEKADIFAGTVTLPNHAVLNAYIKLTNGLSLADCDTMTDDQLLDILLNESLKSINLTRCALISDAVLQVLSQNATVEEIILNGTTQLDISQLIRPSMIPGTAATREIKSVPKAIRTVKLTRLELKQCSQLTDEMLAPFTFHPSLDDISFSPSKVTSKGFISFITGNKTVTHISFEDFDSTNLTDAMFQALCSNQLLTHLSLPRCSAVTDDALGFVAGMDRLEGLDIGDCAKVGDTGISQLLTLTQLSSLTLRNNLSVNGAMLLMLNNLRTLNLQGCSNVTVDSIISLSKTSLILDYDLSGTAVNDEVIENLVLRNLFKSIRLVGCPDITDVSIIYLSTLPKVEVELGDLPKVTPRCFANLSFFPTNNVLTAVIEMLGDVDFSDNERVTNSKLAVLSKNRKLKRLNLSNCPDVDDMSMDILARSESLEELILVKCDQVSKIQPLMALPNLSRLEMMGCWRLSDVQITQLASHPKLVSIGVSRCRISEGALLQLVRPKKYERLSLSGLSEVTSSVVGQLISNSSLKCLDVSDCSRVGDEMLKSIGQIKSLEDLNLAGCADCTDVGVKSLSELRLKTLNLSRTKVQGMNIIGILTKNTLKELYLSECPLNPQGFRAFRSCKLKFLDLGGVKNISMKDITQIFAKNLGIEYVNLEKCQKLSTDNFETERAKLLSADQVAARKQAIEKRSTESKPRRQLLNLRSPEEAAPDMPAPDEAPPPLPDGVRNEPAMLVLELDKEILQDGGKKAPHNLAVADEGSRARVPSGASAELQRHLPKSVLGDTLLAQGEGNELDAVLDRFAGGEENSTGRSAELITETEKINKLIAELRDRYIPSLRELLTSERSMRVASQTKTLTTNLKSVASSVSISMLNISSLKVSYPDPSEIQPLPQAMFPNWKALCEVSLRALSYVEDKLKVFSQEAGVMTEFEQANKIGGRLLIMKQLLISYFDQKTRRDSGATRRDSGASMYPGRPHATSGARLSGPSTPTTAPEIVLIQQEKESTKGIIEELKYNMKNLQRMVKSNMAMLDLSIAIATLVKHIKLVLEIAEPRQLNIQQYVVQKPIPQFLPGLDFATQQKIQQLQVICGTTLAQQVDDFQRILQSIDGEANLKVFVANARRVDHVRVLLSAFFGAQYIRSSFESSVDLLDSFS